MKNISNAEISSLCRSLSTLIHAGIGIGDGFALMAEDEQEIIQKRLLQQMAEKADWGLQLSEIFADSGAFPAYVCTLMKTGEKTGKQEDVLRALADYYDERMRIECQIRTALLYPAILFIVMLTVIFVLLTRVLPVFDSVYVQLGSQLTGIAGGLLLLGSILKRMMPLMCVFAAFVAVLLVSFVSSVVFREKTLEMWTQYYGSRGISGMMNRARIAHVLAMGMESGLNMEDTLSLAAELTQHVPELSRRCISCGRDLAEGMNIMEAFRLYEILPNSECRLLEAGIKSGCGERTMREIARRLQEDSQMQLQKRLGQAEPAMVLTASVLTGVILLTVMLPLVNIMAAVG